MRTSALLLASLAVPLLAQGAPEARFTELALQGASAFDRGRVERLLRLRAGAELPLAPERLAAVLQARYRDDGYPAARVLAAFAPESGLLTLRVDEGRLTDVALPSLSAAAAARARQALRLEPHGPLRAADLSAAWARLEQASGGALSAGSEEYVPQADGSRLELRPDVQRVARGLALHGPHTAGYYNRVDGLNLGAGLELRLADLRRYEHLHLSLQGSYAQGGDYWRYAFSAARPLAGRRLWLGYEFHDLSDRDDAYRLVGLDEAPGTSLLERSLSDFYRRRGHEAFAFVRLGERAEAGVSFRSERFSSLVVSTDGNPFGAGTPRPNPAIDAGDQRSVLATVRWSKHGPLHGSDEQQRRSFLLRSLWGTLDEPPAGLRFEATLERGSLEQDGASTRDFTRLTAVLRGRHALAGGLRLDTRVHFGWGSARLPAQRRLTLGGEGSLRGYALDTFPGERVLAATGELSLQPLRRGLRLIGFYDLGGTWSARDGGGSGAKSDWGLGLRFPANGSTFLRFELARPIGGAGPRATRRLWRLQLPL